MPLFKKERKPLSDNVRRLLEDIINHSQYWDLKGNKREDKIYDLNAEVTQLLTINMEKTLGPEKYKIYQSYLSKGDVPTANQYVMQQIPDFYGAFFMSNFQQLADKYYVPSADDLLNGSK